MACIRINDYRFDTAAEVAAAFAMFPQLRDKIFFVEAYKGGNAKDAPLACHGPAWEKHKDDPARVAEVRGRLERTFSSGQSRAVRSGKFPDLWFIVLNMFDRRTAFQQVFTFDHELGHQLVPYGSFGATREGYLSGESAADAFGALRCFQRFGLEQGLELMSARAADGALALVKGTSHYTADWEHLTTQVLAQIVKEAPTANYGQLSPQETIDLADTLARRYAPDDKAAQEIWRRSRDLGDFSEGAGTEEHHWEEQARKGGSKARLETGLRFLHGEGVTKDEARAFHWIAQAAQRQNADAQAWMGYCYLNGKGVAKNLPEAFHFYRLAAEQDCAEGLRGVADCYARGEGVPRDDKAAVDWYKRAADAGDGYSQYKLSEIYTEGRGAAADLAEAQRWLVKAAATGNAEAKKKLGVSNLKVTPPDPAQARPAYKTSVSASAAVEPPKSAASTAAIPADLLAAVIQYGNGKKKEKA